MCAFKESTIWIARVAFATVVLAGIGLLGEHAGNSTAWQPAATTIVAASEPPAVRSI